MKSLASYIKEGEDFTAWVVDKYAEFTRKNATDAIDLIVVQGLGQVDMLGAGKRKLQQELIATGIRRIANDAASRKRDVDTQELLAAYTPKVTPAGKRLQRRTTAHQDYMEAHNNKTFFQTFRMSNGRTLLDYTGKEVRVEAHKRKGKARTLQVQSKWLEWIADQTHPEKLVSAKLAEAGEKKYVEIHNATP